MKKYDLEEGSIVIENIQKDGVFGNNDFPPGTFQNEVTLDEFEAAVAEQSAYQKSKEGRMAKKMNDFGVKSRQEKWSEDKIDQFFIDFDQEFGTNYFAMFRSKNISENSFRFSTFGMNRSAIDSINRTTQMFVDSITKNK